MRCDNTQCGSASGAGILIDIKATDHSRRRWGTTHRRAEGEKKKLWWRDEEAVQRVFFAEKVPTRDIWGAQKDDLRYVTWPELKKKKAM